MNSFTNATFDEIQIGQSLTVSRIITRNDIEALTFVSGDIDEAYLREEVGPDHVPSKRWLPKPFFLIFSTAACWSGHHDSRP